MLKQLPDSICELKTLETLKVDRNELEIFSWKLKIS